MHKMILPLLLTLACAGCATDPYGSFVKIANIDQQKLAGEAAKQLVVLYPPAKTHLEIKQVPSDVFGSSLVNKLREQGYAVREFNGEVEETSPSAARPLCTLLDQVGEANLYVMTLRVGNQLVGHQSLTRLYTVQNGSLIPTGRWVHKE